MPRVLDPEGAHLAALRRLGDFRDQRVLELGCGDGRLTVGIGADAASVLALDPDAEDVATAAVDVLVCAGRLVETARDDHDVRKHYPNGAELIDDFAGKERRLPPEAIPALRVTTCPCAVRE